MSLGPNAYPGLPSNSASDLELVSPESCLRGVTISQEPRTDLRCHAESVKAGVAAYPACRRSGVAAFWRRGGVPAAWRRSGAGSAWRRGGAEGCRALTLPRGGGRSAERHRRSRAPVHRRGAKSVSCREQHGASLRFETLCKFSDCRCFSSTVNTDH